MKKKKVRDSMFRALFKEEKNARELFIALGNELGPDEKLEIVTLEYALGDKVQNDLAMKAGDRCIVLTEAQTTFSPNIPVRILEYAARTYELILERVLTYGEKEMKIPAPKFYVLYNGNRKWEDGTLLKLSDMYAEPPAENSLDAVVKVVNIRYNGGSEVLEKSSMLKEYAAFIEAYTDKIHKGVDESVAIGETLKEFIADGSILTGFLRKHEKEVDIMLSGITKEEYGYLRHQEGLEQGFEMGMEEQKCHIIRHMVEQGYDSEKIAELTGFDADEVEKYM